MRLYLRSLIVIPIILISSLPAFAEDDARAEFFESRVRPVLLKHCFGCHGGETTNAELRVDRLDSLLKGGESGPALVPGKAAYSLMIRALSHADEDLQMPPEEKLPEQVIQDLTTWIQQGAVWPKIEASDFATDFEQHRHWAFQPVQTHKPPVDETGWAQTEIDRFVGKQLSDRQLIPAQPAERAVLMRRAYYDLHGLPPTIAEMEKFLNDKSPDAYANLIDRLLATPRYGERWGRYWMDVVRYADTAGDNADYPVPELRLYRDYIIDSFNKDKPYNEFVREQIAGDLIALEYQDHPEKYAELVTATSFIALSRRYATAPFELMHLTIEDTIDTTSRAFLGLVMKCARCHDHKFDPLTQEDYYGLYSIFANTQYPFAGSEEFQSKKIVRSGFRALMPDQPAQELYKKHRQTIQELSDKIKNAVTEKSDPQQIETLQRELHVLQRPGLPAGLKGAYAVGEGPQVETRIHIQGDPAKPGAVARRQVPAFLATGQKIDFPENVSGRLQLANWLASEENPLTARVIVNRVWQHHFGRGLVGTPSNFGLRGERPTHPELLDWLTRRFLDSGWSIKALHKKIMLSRTYQMASDYQADNHAQDPGNHYLWRFNKRRLDAESTRDAMLMVSGQLDLNRPGEHPFPPIKDWGWTQHHPFKAVYPSKHRSVFLMTQRLQRHPFLALFDGPDTNTTTAARTESTVPLQSLYLMNSPWVEEYSGHLALRLIENSSEVTTRIQLAHQWAYSRKATENEAERGVIFIEQAQNVLSASGVAAPVIEAQIWVAYAQSILTANEFVYLD